MCKHKVNGIYLYGIRTYTIDIKTQQDHTKAVNKLISEHTYEELKDIRDKVREDLERLNQAVGLRGMIELEEDNTKKWLDKHT